jgi:RNA polymerase sigma factor (sigma-70 family)
MDDDAQLLRRYRDHHAEDAFTELVRRHVNLVYFAALRQTAGDTMLAEDITQAVFTDLARKAAELANRSVLTGWLYTSTRYAAANAMRAERRRHAREQEAYMMHEYTANAATERDWTQLRPLIDDAMHSLGERDREAVLLRFFEGRAFAEIGRALQLTEDTARKRVERALEKMSVALARRGFTSSASALGATLAYQAQAAAPAGLASSVTVAAVAAAAAGGAGASLTAATVGFMGSTKMSGAMIAAAFALAASVGANGYLWREQKQAASGDVVSAPALVTAEPETRPSEVSAASLRTDEPAALRDKLRTVGVSDATVRSVVEGILRRRYREKLSANRAEQLRTAWWRDRSWFYVNPTSGEAPPAIMEDRPLLREMVLDPMEKLFGADSVELAEYEARFEFLPTEKRAAFVALEREHEVAMARLSGPEQNSVAGAHLVRERDEKRTALLAALTSNERAEYELRFSRVATAVKERMQQIAASEAEYRTIMAVIAQPVERKPDESAARSVARRDEASTQQLVVALGYDRALDYIWSGALEYPSYARVTHTPGRVLQLAAETTEQAIEIHRDGSLTPGQKRDAVIALQRQVRPQLDALLPPSQQQRLAPMMLTWFTALGEGSYKRTVTSLGGAVGGVLSPGVISVETAPPPPESRQFFVRRIPGS